MIPFVDAHIHLWDLNHIRYDWLSPPFSDEGPNGSVEAIAQDYGVAQYRADLARWNVVGAVHVFTSNGKSWSDKKLALRKEARDAADRLCTALQVLNHLQDCASDWTRLGRCYLPLDWMAQAGARVEELEGE